MNAVVRVDGAKREAREDEPDRVGDAASTRHQSDRSGDAKEQKERQLRRHPPTRYTIVAPRRRAKSWERDEGRRWDAGRQRSSVRSSRF